MRTLMELAKVIRSKNASPFVTALDVFFEDEGAYRLVKESKAITKEVVASLYGLPSPDHVLGIWYVDGCLGIKISFLRPVPTDDLLAADVYGAQQHLPLAELVIG